MDPPRAPTPGSGLCVAPDSVQTAPSADRAHRAVCWSLVKGGDAAVPSSSLPSPRGIALCPAPTRPAGAPFQPLQGKAGDSLRGSVPHRPVLRGIPGGCTSSGPGRGHPASGAGPVSALCLQLPVSPTPCTMPGGGRGGGARRLSAQRAAGARASQQWVLSVPLPGSGHRRAAPGVLSPAH